MVTKEEVAATAMIVTAYLVTLPDEEVSKIINEMKQDARSRGVNADKYFIEMENIVKEYKKGSL